jgi:hypothetical protein
MLNEDLIGAERLGGDVASGAGSIPYLGLAKFGYNVAKDPVRGLMSPATPQLAASLAGYLTGGLAAGAGSAMTGIGAVLAAIILSQKMGLWGRGTGSTAGAFTKDTGSGVSGPAFIAAQGSGILGGPDEAERYKFLQSRLPSVEDLSSSFKQQTGYDAPGDKNIKATEGGGYYQNWMDRQPEIAAARRDWNKYVGDTYDKVEYGAGDEGDKGFRWVKKNNSSGLMGSFDTTIG